MTDRELLEMAAKAAGLRVWRGQGYQEDMFFTSPSCPDSTGKVAGVLWSPLTDDGDALRLASDVGINISYHSSIVDSTAGLIVAQSSGFPGITVTQQSSHNKSERQKSTRRVIVRAAAEIGKSIP